VFIHGLWPVGSSWDRWATSLQAGYAPLAPGWQMNPPTVAEATRTLSVRRKKVGPVATITQASSGGSRKSPRIATRCGLLTQMRPVADSRWIGAIDPARFAACCL